jgi:hypothetical protein
MAGSAVDLRSSCLLRCLLERRQAVAAFSTSYMGFRWSELGNSQSQR